MPARAEIVVVGSEILTGKVRDENGPYLAADLRELGVELLRITTVPDVRADIAATVAAASARADFVVTSGGVGPTLDDVTFDGVAEAFGVGLRRFDEMAAVLRDFFGAAVNEAHLTMADLPEGAELVFSEGLKFPVVKVRNVYVLPGAPPILRKKWAALRETFRGMPFTLRRVYVTTEEGALAPALDRVHEAVPEAALGSYPVFDDPTYAVMITLESQNPEVVRRAFERLMSLLDPRTVTKVE
jgi:molybdenum cofactor synthesis domain-containing protein